MIEFISLVFEVIGRALRLDPALLRAAEALPPAQGDWVVVTVALLAGASQLLGQSVTLLANRVSPGRFTISLLLNGIIFALGLLIWATTIWLVAGWLFAVPQSLNVVLRMVALGSAPWVFGFLVLIPYMGTFIGRVLAVWSFLITLGAIRFAFQVELWAALVAVGAGWLLMMLLSLTIGRPVVLLRNWLWQRIVGTRLDVSLHEILATITRDQPDPPSRSGGTQ
jgi:hypothetical protein